jgi:hypothetical protein
MFVVGLGASSASAADLRLGIIGTDTSHVIAFTKVLNDASDPQHVPGARVVAAFKGGSPDLAQSRDRIEKFSSELRNQWHIRFVKRIPDLCPLVDGILLESVDGRVHLAQFRQAAECGKPVFIDKPLASTFVDVEKIAQIAAEKHIPWFSSSSVRYGQVQSLVSPGVTGAMVWGPGPLEPTQKLDLAWYAIHPIEMLFTIMGPDIEQVTRTYTPDADVVTGVWSGARLGTVRAGRNYGTYGAVVFYKKGKPVANDDVKDSYAPLVQEIVKFMQTRVPPVPNQTTLQIYRFIYAAQQSRERGGIPIKISK